MERDFTYIDDLVEAIWRLIDIPPVLGSGDPSTSPAAPYRIVNIGRGETVNLLDFIDTVEQKLGKKAIRNYVEMQKGDAPRTLADSDLLARLTGYRPSTGVAEGVSALVDWYRDYRAKQC
jgi:UDP-glucuronate 4-epimerase